MIGYYLGYNGSAISSVASGSALHFALEGGKLVTYYNNTLYYLNASAGALSLGTNAGSATTWTKNDSAHTLSYTDGNSRTWYLAYDGGWHCVPFTEGITIANNTNYLGYNGSAISSVASGNALHFALEGGKRESPEDCVIREAKEETGLTVVSPSFRGIITFVSDRYGTEYMHLFTADRFSGTLRDCDEGELAWGDKDRVPTLPLWEGDRILLEFDHLRVGVDPVERKDVFDRRAAETIDALIVVPDHHHVPVSARQQLGQAELRGVGVLVFVHRDVAELGLIVVQRFFVFFQVSFAAASTRSSRRSRSASPIGSPFTVIRSFTRTRLGEV